MDGKSSVRPTGIISGSGSTVVQKRCSRWGRYGPIRCVPARAVASTPLVSAFGVLGAGFRQILRRYAIRPPVVTVSQHVWGGFVRVECFAGGFVGISSLHLSFPIVPGPENRYRPGPGLGTFTAHSTVGPVRAADSRPRANPECRQPFAAATRGRSRSRRTGGRERQRRAPAASR